MLHVDNTKLSALSVKQLSLQVGGKKILDDVSFEIMAQKKVAVVGLNGAGKSSLIRLLIGELLPSQGKIGFQLFSPTKLDFKKQLGYQASGMLSLDNFSAREYLQMCCLLKNTHHSQIQSQLELVITQWGLSDIINQSMQNLSQGNLQKVMIAQAFLGQPQIIILDEPTQALDPIEQQRFIDNLAGLSHCQICLFSSHHINEAVETADEVLMLHQGKSVALLDLKATNEFWLVSQLTEQQIVELADQPLSIELSYHKVKFLYRLKNISYDEQQTLVDVLVKKDPCLINLGSANQVLMPLFSLLANGRL